MPYDSSGVATVERQIAVTGQVVQAVQVNTPFSDIESMLSQQILRSGVAPFSGNQSMAGFKITNAANGSADGDYVTMSQLNAVIASVTTGTMPTGAVAGFRTTTPPTGWIKENGGTIGSGASGATNRANSDTQNLFTLLWDQFNQATLPIQDSSGAVTTRGASAAADFAAAKRMPLFDSRSRFLRGADDGLGFDASIVVGLSQADDIKTIPDVWLWSGTESTLGFAGGTVYAGRGSTQSRPSGWPTGTETRPRSSAVLMCIKL